MAENSGIGEEAQNNSGFFNRLFGVRQPDASPASTVPNLANAPDYIKPHMMASGIYGYEDTVQPSVEASTATANPAQSDAARNDIRTSFIPENATGFVESNHEAYDKQHTAMVTAVKEGEEAAHKADPDNALTPEAFRARDNKRIENATENNPLHEAGTSPSEQILPSTSANVVESAAMPASGDAEALTGAANMSVEAGSQRNESLDQLDRAGLEARIKSIQEALNMIYDNALPALFDRSTVVDNEASEIAAQLEKADNERFDQVNHFYNRQNALIKLELELSTGKLDRVLRALRIKKSVQAEALEKYKLERMRELVAIAMNEGRTGAEAELWAHDALMTEEEEAKRYDTEFYNWKTDKQKALLAEFDSKIAEFNSLAEQQNALREQASGLFQKLDAAMARLDELTADERGDLTKTLAELETLADTARGATVRGDAAWSTMVDELGAVAGGTDETVASGAVSRGDTIPSGTLSDTIASAPAGVDLDDTAPHSRVDLGDTVASAAVDRAGDTMRSRRVDRDARRAAEHVDGSIDAALESTGKSPKEIAEMLLKDEQGLKSVEDIAADFTTFAKKSRDHYKSLAEKAHDLKVGQSQLLEQVKKELAEEFDRRLVEQTQKNYDKFGVLSPEALATVLEVLREDKKLQVLEARRDAGDKDAARELKKLRTAAKKKVDAFIQSQHDLADEADRETAKWGNEVLYPVLLKERNDRVFSQETTISLIGDLTKAEQEALFNGKYANELRDSQLAFENLLKLKSLTEDNGVVADGIAEAVIIQDEIRDAARENVAQLTESLAQAKKESRRLADKKVVLTERVSSGANNRRLNKNQEDLAVTIMALKTANAEVAKYDKQLKAAQAELPAVEQAHDKAVAAIYESYLPVEARENGKLFPEGEDTSSVAGIYNETVLGRSNYVTYNEYGERDEAGDNPAALMPRFAQVIAGMPAEIEAAFQRRRARSESVVA